MQPRAHTGRDRDLRAAGTGKLVTPFTPNPKQRQPQHVDARSCRVLHTSAHLGSPSHSL